MPHVGSLSPCVVFTSMCRRRRSADRRAGRLAGRWRLVRGVLGRRGPFFRMAETFRPDLSTSGRGEKFSAILRLRRLPHAHTHRHFAAHRFTSHSSTLRQCNTRRHKATCHTDNTQHAQYAPLRNTPYRTTTQRCGLAASRTRGISWVPRAASLVDTLKERPLRLAAWPVAIGQHDLSRHPCILLATLAQHAKGLA